MIPEPFIAGCGRVSDIAGASHGCRRHTRHSSRAASSSRARQPAGAAAGSGTAPNTASIMKRVRSSLPGTCRYSDMVATPSSAAILRIDTSAMPSVSAMPIAVATIRSRVSSTPSRRAGHPGAGRRPAAGDDGADAGPDRVRPSCRRTARALVAVAIATPHWRVICRADGTRSPGASSPASMRRRMSSTTRR